MVTEAIKGALKLALTEAGQAAAEKFLAEQGFTNPTVRVKDDEEVFEAIITGGSVEKDIDLPIMFDSDYWEGLLTLNQKAEDSFYRGRDRLTVAMDINHKRDVHRPTDDFRGSLAQVKLEIDPDRKDKDLILESGNQYKAKEEKDRVAHAKGHSDLYFGNLSATISGDSIESWTFRVTGEHLTRQVSSLTIPPAEGASGGIATVLVLAPEEIPPLASLNLALEFSPRLRLGNSDVRTGPLLASASTHLGCAQPGRLELEAVTRGEIRGPGVLAMLDFHLPEAGRLRSFPVFSSRIEGTGLDGQPVDLGVNNTVVTVRA
jgi:hypothetical protein